MVVEEYAKQAEKQSYLGRMIWWKLRNVAVANDALKQMYADNDLSEYFPDRPSEKKCFIEAVKRHAQAEGVVCKKMGETDSTFTMWVGSEAGNMITREMETAKLFDVTFDKTSYELSFNGANGTELLATYQYNREHYTTSDMRRGILEMLNSLKSFNVRPDGGVYFVPEKFDTIVLNYKKLIAGLNGDSCHMWTLPLPNISESRKDMMRAFIEMAESQLHQADKHLDGIEDDIVKKTVRKGTLVNRIKEYKEFREKASLYQALFQGQAMNIENGIGKLERRAMELMLKID